VTTRRWASIVAWLAILAPLPYTVLRVLWAAGVPFGIDRELLREFHAPGWGSLYILGLTALADATALIVHSIVRPRARRIPGWVPILGGARVRPRLVIAVLLLPTVVLAWRAALHLTVVVNGFRLPDEVTGVPAWSVWVQIVLVWIWAPSLAAALVAYQRATSTRAHSRPPRRRDGEQHGEHRFDALRDPSRGRRAGRDA
jgi:hypothetical protein